MTRYGKRIEKNGRAERIARLRTLQLVVCLVIFSTVYLAKGVFPYKVQRLGEEITTLVTDNADFTGALTQLGDALTSGDSMLEELGEFCVTVFGGTAEGSVPISGTIEIIQPTIESAETLPAETNPIATEEPDVIEPEPTASEPDELVVSTVEPAEVMEVGLVYRAAPEGTRELPEGYTADMLSLGNMSRVAPVVGTINSSFGYRIHPIAGAEAIHNGVDISGEVGDPIVAFGGGRVEYTGESDIYGLYFRIDHGNGVKSFYAHCSEILVQQGEEVELGQQVAKVGATGNVTGPHLHFELLCKGIRIDPALYIEHL